MSGIENNFGAEVSGIENNFSDGLESFPLFRKQNNRAKMQEGGMTSMGEDFASAFECDPVWKAVTKRPQQPQQPPKPTQRKSEKESVDGSFKIDSDV